MHNRQKKDVRLNLRMTSDLYQALRGLANRTGYTVSGLVRLGMQMVLEKYGQAHKQVESGKSQAKERL